MTSPANSRFTAHQTLGQVTAAGTAWRLARYRAWGEFPARRRIVSEVLVKFKLVVALATAALCAAVVSCSSGSAATASTQAPPITVLTKGADNGNGDIFLAPQGGGQYGTGPEIVSITGKVLWFHRLPADTFTTDFRTQTYLGKPGALTWFQGKAIPAARALCTTPATSRSPPSSRRMGIRPTSIPQNPKTP